MATATAISSTREDRALTVLMWLLATAVVVSVVHYADNFVNYDAFPLAESIPNPSRNLVGLAWLLFTGAGIGGYVLFRGGSYPTACLLLGVYSGSGLVGFGHYAASGMTEAAWWRQAHVVADILLGLAILLFAVWAALNLPSPGRGPESPPWLRRG